MNKPFTNRAHGARRIRTPDMLSAEVERDLVRAWHNHGDRRARDRLLRAFTPLAISVARRFNRGTREPDPDLVQQAHIGLMKAADRFDPERDIRFSTYAVWWVRAEVQAYARANISVVRRPNSAKARAAASRIAALDAEISADPGVDPGDATGRLADALGVDREKALDLRAQVTGTDQSLNMPTLEEGGEERIALLVDPDSLDGSAPVKRLEAEALRRVLVEVLATLPDREREIIVATQVADPPATLEGLGARYGVSKERIRQLRERGFERLRAALRRRGLSLENLF
ncbi:sigma-70 family RNA polymerase sigma factor [Roseovarius salis]|uniref:sigma-70 family RNA polymerase sigma factor n=1 Tax=Roseovarius salis TaxID=3376063 RepID=UPI0037CA0560